MFEESFGVKCEILEKEWKEYMMELKPDSE
jgi:hypothetical protein